MPVRLFVGNLPYDTSEAELRQHFAAIGPLSHVFIPVDRETGRPRGFAFVEFTDRPQAEDAITRLHNQPFKGRPLSVSEARAREDRPPGARPPGPPRSDWTPRPAPGGFGSRPPASDAAAPGDTRRREFGPDAPPRRGGRAKSAKARREEKPTGPIPIRGGGRIYDVDDFEEPGDDVEFDDISTSKDENDE